MSIIGCIILTIVITVINVYILAFLIFIGCELWDYPTEHMTKLGKIICKMFGKNY